MKILFCTFLSIFAFSWVANATNNEDFDPEVTAAFSTSTPPTLTDSTAPQILPEDFLSKNRTALATRLSRIKPAAPEVAEEEKFGKRKREETTTITRPIPIQEAFKEPTERKGKCLTWEEHCAWVKQLPPPTPRAGYYEFRHRCPGGGHSEYWKKEYNSSGELIGFA
jgi:hypothetical protein